MSEPKPQPRLLCFLDAMCSWCYGFSPVMDKIADHFGDRLEYFTFSGGLRPFNKEPMAPEMREKLAATYEKIGEITGQPFTTARLMDPDFIYDTEPASRAIVAMRHLTDGEDYSYYLTIQRAFYAQGEDITQDDVLAGYAARFEIPKETFLETFRSEKIREATMSDFRVAQNFGITGFPTLVLHRLDGKNPQAMLLVGQGYAAAEEMIERIEAALVADV
ncbi:MAG: DsbA family protein [Rhizobiales bacterium]|nr:DsbA family protein [Hyphomicrobiales bacterium]